MNGGTCLHETPGERLPRGRKKNVRCNRSSLLTNSLPYKEGQRSEDLRDERRTALLNGLPGGPFGDVLGLAPLGPRLLSNNWRGPEGRVRVPTGSRARTRTVRASLFPLR